MSSSDFLIVLALLAVITATQCQTEGHTERAADALEKLSNTLQRCAERPAPRVDVLP